MRFLIVLIGLLVSLESALAAKFNFAYRLPGNAVMDVLIDSTKNTIEFTLQDPRHPNKIVQDFYLKSSKINLPDPDWYSNGENELYKFDRGHNDFFKTGGFFFNEIDAIGNEGKMYRIDLEASVKNGRFVFVPSFSELSLVKLARSGRKTTSSESPQQTLEFKENVVEPKENVHVTERTIKNSQYRAHLDSLNTRLNNIVLGQSEAVKSVVTALESRAVLPSKKPPTLLFLGSTGTGKTELAKAVAQEHYYDPKAYIDFNMGELKRAGDLNNIFGSATGFLGADETPPFEKFLTDNPNGGVILFDEIGNMGETKADRDGMLKKFYQMLDEGKWKNRKGVDFDLSKYVIIFTSNEGQEVFDGLTTDKSRMKAWDKAKSPDQLGKILNRSGWPDAIIPRFEGNITLFKPLLSSERAVIAKNFAKSTADMIQKEHNVKVTFADGFADKVADSFFSHKQGVRQIKIPTVTDLSGLLGKELKNLYQNPSELANVTFNIDLHDKIIEGKDGKAPERKVTLDLTVKSPGKEDRILTADLTSKAPQRFLERSIKVPEYRKHLSTLNARISQSVIGQPDAVESVVRSIQSRAVTEIKKPSTYLFLGSTGTGKTELAKSVAKQHYLDETAFVDFNMGEIKSESDLNKLFGSQNGFVGSDKQAPFEIFLDKNPNGGVVLLDEIGNMGKDPKSRESLLKVFYQMLDEGKWTNRDGKEYDLSKYSFVFTSNEGQEVFEGLSTDSSRIAAWERNKGPDNLGKILKKSGWPEALIPRMQGNILLFKPLVQSERAKIAKIFAQNVAKDIEEKHGLKIKFADKFYDKVADSFFSHAEGIRQMQIPTVTDLSSLIGEQLFALYEDPDKLGKTSITVDLDDVTSKDGKRTVTLKTTAQTPGEADKLMTSDLTSKAPEKITTSKMNKLRTAIHEASHAVANEPTQTGIFVNRISVLREGQTLGVVEYNAVPNFREALTREQAVAKIASLLAGGIGEDMYFPTEGKDNGRLSDLQQAKKVAQSVVDGGMGRKGQYLNPAEAAEEIDSLIKEGDEMARKLLKTRWIAVRTTAARLMNRGALGQAEFEKAVMASGVRIQTGKSKVGTVKPYVSRGTKCPPAFGSLFSNFVEP